MARALLDLEAECSDEADDVGSDEDEAGSLMDFIDDGDVSMRSRTPSSEEASPRGEMADSPAEESAVAEQPTPAEEEQDEQARAVSRGSGGRRRAGGKGRGKK